MKDHVPCPTDGCPNQGLNTGFSVLECDFCKIVPSARGRRIVAELFEDRLVVLAGVSGRDLYDGLRDASFINPMINMPFDRITSCMFRIRMMIENRDMIYNADWESENKDVEIFHGDDVRVFDSYGLRTVNSYGYFCSRVFIGSQFVGLDRGQYCSFPFSNIRDDGFSDRRIAPSGDGVPIYSCDINNTYY